MIRSHVCVPIHFSFHLLLSALAIAPVCIASHAQPDSTASAQIVAGVSGAPLPELLDRQEVFRRIGIYEDAARRAGSLHLDHQSMIKLYRNLGVLYEMADMIPNSEAATQRAIELMKDGPQDELAEEFNNLSVIHGLMGDLRRSEKDQMRALAIREKIGDPVGIALTWTDMAGVYCQERQFKKALEYARKSYDVLAKRTDMKPTNHAAVLQVMAFALCGARQCSEAVPIMKQAVDESKSAFGPDSLSAAAQGFALGYLYWQSGDTADAAEWMRRSLTRMKTELGWGAPLYVKSIRQYARFLHQTGQREEASNAESEVRRIESVVDARTLTTRGGELLSSGTR